MSASGDCPSPLSPPRRGPHRRQGPSPASWHELMRVQVQQQGQQQRQQWCCWGALLPQDQRRARLHPAG